MPKPKNRTPKQKLSYFGLFAAIVFFIWFVIRFLTLECNLAITNSYEFPSFPDLDIKYDTASDYAISVDGHVVAAKSQEIRPTASTAKMILGLAIMKEKPFELGTKGETIEISQEFYDKYLWYVSHNGSNTEVAVGENISEYDALVSVFLASSNNMADSLALWAFGSHENYQNYATEMLREWGIENTIIGEDASGFSDTTTSTASDLAKIGAKVLENPVLAEIVGTKQYTVPVAGTIHNTNKLLGINNIIGVKTGYIGDASGYCLITGYKESDHNITVALLGAPTRQASFNESLAIVNTLQDLAKPQTLIEESQIIGYYDSWWTGQVPIRASEDFSQIGFKGAETSANLIMEGSSGSLELRIADDIYTIPAQADELELTPSFFDKIKRVFGWQKETND